MKKIYYWIATFTTSLLVSGCGDGISLPGLPGNVETDLNKIPLPNTDLVVPLKPETEPMIHCGGLHTPEDFQRIKDNLNLSPWKEGYELLKANKLAGLTTTMNVTAVEIVKRGIAGDENYMNAAKAAHRAYQLGLRWKLGDGDEYAQAAVDLLNNWARTTKGLGGNSNVSLAAGIYGYQFAVAGELLRDFSGWAPEDFAAYQKWMLDVWYPANKDFLVRHHDTPPGHYWANWGLCNVASTIAIGILADRRDIYNEGIKHFQVGETNGCITKAIYYVFDGADANLAQWQESNRDQGHTYMCQGLMGIICQLTWNQGDDFFSYNDNMFLKACEYTAKYNYAGLEVPNLPYTRELKGAYGIAYEEYLQISARDVKLRPIWALPYYHYAKISGTSAEKMQYSKMAMEANAPEGGGDNYGGDSGGYDALGFGTLMYAR